MINFIQEAITELYRCFDIINEEKFEGKLPQPIITIQKTPKAIGHCTVHKVWTNVDTEEPQEDNDYYELNIASNYMNKGVEEIQHTLMHECCHLYNLAVVGKKDCTGRKHNKKFYKVATEMVGLTIDGNDSKVGYGYTQLNDETRKFINEVIKPDPEKFKYFYYIAPKPEKEKVEHKKFNTIYFCPNCDLEIKLEEALGEYEGFGSDIVCPCCGDNFELKPKGKRGRKARDD